MTRILLVEDSKNLNKALALRLQHAGYEVAGVHTAEEARQRAPTFQPQLAILDVNLPDGNGFDLAGELRAAVTGELTVVLATANRDPSLQQRARSLDAVALLNKPFDATELLATVSRAIEGSLTPAAAH